MEKFSKLEKEEKLDKKSKEKILWENDIIKVREIEGWTVVGEVDAVICIPILVEENKFYIRQEYIPSYKYVNDKEHHLTVIAGSIEDGETPEKTLRRELEEEAGIRLREQMPIEFESPLFISKGTTNRFHCCLLPLTRNDYTEVQPTGDGTIAEENSKTVIVDAKYINNLKPSDIITELMLMKLKSYLNVE